MSAPERILTPRQRLNALLRKAQNGPHYDFTFLTPSELLWLAHELGNTEKHSWRPRAKRLAQFDLGSIANVNPLGGSAEPNMRELLIIINALNNIYNTEDNV